MGTPLPEHAPRHCILAAVDFSPGSDAALDVAAELAEAMKLPLLLLHVVHDPAHAPGFYNVPDGLDDKQLKKHKKRTEKRARTIRGAAEDMLRGYLAARRDAAPERKALDKAHIALVVGTPASRIVEVADERSAKMIVMGTRGRGALSGILLGSNANRVVQLSHVPVTLVKADRERAPKKRQQQS